MFENVSFYRLRACSYGTYSGLGIQTEVRIRVPFA